MLKLKKKLVKKKQWKDFFRYMQNHDTQWKSSNQNTLIFYMVSNKKTMVSNEKIKWWSPKKPTMVSNEKTLVSNEKIMVSNKKNIVSKWEINGLQRDNYGLQY